MKISIETYIMRERHDDKTAIKMIKEAGFDCYDYSMYWVYDEEKDMLNDDYKERATELRAYADKLGIECNQAHAPFDLRYSEGLDLSVKNYQRVVRSIEVASILGAKNIIVHVLSKGLPDNMTLHEANRIYLESLLPYCEKFNICISVENLFGWENKATPVLSDPIEHMNFVESLNSDKFSICVDVGHSAITGYPPENVINAMNSNILKSLHIQDNNCIVDQHQVPFVGELNWDKIIEALRNIGYNGDFTFELTSFLRKTPTELLDNSLKFAANIARYFAQKITE